MSGFEDGGKHDGDLWRLFSEATGRPQQRQEIDPNALAAYLDGTTRREVVEEVERAMAADPALLDAVVELRESVGVGQEEVPQEVRLRIKSALLAEAGEGESRPRPVVLRPRTPWWVAAAAAAVLLVSILGYQLGRHSVDADADRNSALQRELYSELTYGGAEGDLLAAFERLRDEKGGLW